MSIPTFDKINYSLRIAKGIERKMLSHCFQRLHSFDNLHNYRYIGFGATFFQDFKLFHRDLGISNMISIEVEETQKERFEFNKPNLCIDMRYGSSFDILPSLDWNDKTILWLDYDKWLKSEYLADISTFFSHAQSGSVFLITLNGFIEQKAEANLTKKEELVAELGEKKIPIGLKDSDFNFKKLPGTLKKIVEQEIERIVKIRNLSLTDKFVYKPIFNFIYSDGVRMVTLGGVLHTISDEEKFVHSNFTSLDFIRSDESFFSIEPPILTLKEMALLNTQLPYGIDENGEFIDGNIINPQIPTLSIKNYSLIYKFFPVFTESLVS